LVDVLPKEDDFGPGLRFVSSEQFFAGPGQTQNTRFDFDVAVLAGGNPIIDSELNLTGFGVIESGMIVIRQDLLDNMGNPVGGPNLVFDSAPLARATFAPPLNRLTSSTGIFLTGTANITEFREDFSQVPEPFALTLFGLGLLGVLGFAWLRRAGPGVAIPPR
jgi:hypothetical protein